LGCNTALKRHVTRFAWFDIIIKQSKQWVVARNRFSSTSCCGDRVTPVNINQVDVTAIPKRREEEARSNGGAFFTLIGVSLFLDWKLTCLETEL
jgi:hypothetical protein